VVMRSVPARVRPAGLAETGGAATGGSGVRWRFRGARAWATGSCGSSPLRRAAKQCRSGQQRIDAGRKRENRCPIRATAAST
jgi:hypothetical protein